MEKAVRFLGSEKTVCYCHIGKFRLLKAVLTEEEYEVVRKERRRLRMR